MKNPRKLPEIHGDDLPAGGSAADSLFNLFGMSRVRKASLKGQIRTVLKKAAKLPPFDVGRFRVGVGCCTWSKTERPIRYVVACENRADLLELIRREFNMKPPRDAVLALTVAIRPRESAKNPA